jgi:hypothetical protein
VIFYGQLGSYHPRRSKFMPYLISKNKVKHVAGENSYLGNTLLNSIASVNITLNSDLNSRVFEIAQTGALLIIDKLSINNGHGSVLVPGHNCMTFETVQELYDLLDDVNKLEEMQKICGENLKFEFDSFWGLHNIRERLKKNANGLIGLNLAENYMDIGLKKFSPTNLSHRLNIYEVLMELHRVNEKILLYTDSPQSSLIQSDVSDLPRLSVVQGLNQLEDPTSLSIFLKSNGNDEPYEIYQIKS